MSQIPEFQISYKRKSDKPVKRTITKPEHIAQVCREVFNADTIEWVESLVVLALNTANEVLGFYKLSQGGLTHTICDPRVIMQFALLSNATSIILCHNHPSGNTKPSKEDIKATKQIKAAAALFNVRLLDHIILTSDDFISLYESNLI